MVEMIKYLSFQHVFINLIFFTYSNYIFIISMVLEIKYVIFGNLQLLKRKVEN